jgi:hypothetical protein
MRKKISPGLNGYGLFMVRDNVPHAQSKRGSFWWKDIFSFVGDYRSVSKCKVGNGTSVLLEGFMARLSDFGLEVSKSILLCS